jgi:hypothetical protein
MFIDFGIDQMSSSMSKKHCLGAGWIEDLEFLLSRGYPKHPAGHHGFQYVSILEIVWHSRLDDVEAINWKPPVGCPNDCQLAKLMAKWCEILWVQVVHEGIMNWYELSTYPLGENCFVCHFDPFACWLQNMRCRSYVFLKQSEKDSYWSISIGQLQNW